MDSNSSCKKEPDGVRYILYGRVLRFDKSLQLLFHVEEKVLEGKDHGKESQGIGSKRRRFPWFSACRLFLVEEKVPGRESQDIGCKIKGLRWFLVMHENTSDSWSVGWEQRRLPRFLPVMRKNTFDT